MFDINLFSPLKLPLNIIIGGVVLFIAIAQNIYIRKKGGKNIFSSRKTILWVATISIIIFTVILFLPKSIKEEWLIVTLFSLSLTLPLILLASVFFERVFHILDEREIVIKDLPPLLLSSGIWILIFSLFFGNAGDSLFIKALWNSLADVGAIVTLLGLLSIILIKKKDL